MLLEVLSSSRGQKNRDKWARNWTLTSKLLGEIPFPSNPNHFENIEKRERKVSKRRVIFDW